MKILGIETATHQCAAAIVDGGHVIAEQIVTEPHAHAERLLSLIDRTIEETGETLQSLDAVAVSIGPGSFTGLRIGLSVAKGLCYAAGLPILAVPTLDALALQAIRDRLATHDDFILSMIDARRNEVYAALYRTVEDGFEEISPAQVMTLQDICSLFGKEKRRVVTMGDAQEKLRNFHTQLSMPSLVQWVIPESGQVLGRASSVALLAARRPTIEHNLSVLEPLYLKEFSTTMTSLQPSTSAHS